jgi:hypothetical protein
VRLRLQRRGCRLRALRDRERDHAGAATLARSICRGEDQGDSGPFAPNDVSSVLAIAGR